MSQVPQGRLRPETVDPAHGLETDPAEGATGQPAPNASGVDATALRELLASFTDEHKAVLVEARARAERAAAEIQCGSLRGHALASHVTDGAGHPVMSLMLLGLLDQHLALAQQVSAIGDLPARIAELESALQTAREMYTSARERATLRPVAFVVVREEHGVMDDVIIFDSLTSANTAEGIATGYAAPGEKYTVYALTDITEEPNV